MRVTKVKYVGEYKLEVEFSDKKAKLIDFQSKLQDAHGIFLPLKDPNYFKQAALDDCHLSICWPNGADICPEVLYEMGIDLSA